MEISAGLCIKSKSGRLVANVHSVDKDQVFYGMYRTSDENIEGDCIDLCRVSVADFEQLLSTAIRNEHHVFTLLH